MGRWLFRPTTIALSVTAALSLCAVGYGLRGLSHGMPLVYTAAGLLGLAAVLAGAWFVRRRAPHTEGVAEELTGLRGRARLLTDLEQALTTATPEHPLLLVLLDLVGFKEYNDTFGRQAGYALLKRLAK